MNDKFAYTRAKTLVLTTRNGSTSHLARKLGLDYQAAATLMAQLTCDGIVSAPDSEGFRFVLNAANER